ncbi:hypothetical protein KP509_26G020200 [Ceratopteris richardii]|uniref:Glycosyltransferase 61 catalytic domain-containing protein n=1 Tax=Ceratopteris richardii TaxID=49495 RepID=A0A8T2RIY1_CERRI|nr:hypothetical protein KP509_26G020200 [Ceratopteris richardii]
MVHSCRTTVVFILFIIVVVILVFDLFALDRSLEGFSKSQGWTSSSWKQIQWFARHSTAAGIPQDQSGDTGSLSVLGMDEHAELNTLREQIESLRRQGVEIREEVDRLRRNMSEVEAQIDRALKGRTMVVTLQEKPPLLGIEATQEQAKDLRFSPLIDKELKGADGHVRDAFLSIIEGRGWAEGPPELFFFPDEGGGDGGDGKRLLCLRGNSTSDGTSNSYALANKNQIPMAIALIPGVTLISETVWDYKNPWHAMFNMLQFVYWRINGSCSIAQNLLLFHKGEFRTNATPWITSLMKACGLPWQASDLNKLASTRGGASESSGRPTVCFEQAVVSRRGMGTVNDLARRRVYREARCSARTSCNVHVRNTVNDMKEAERMNYRRHVNVTLFMRSGARSFRDESAWERVVSEQCRASMNCSWTSLHVDDLSFCEQVEGLSHTDILISSHGAQLVNMMFMPEGGSVMEMFPRGWLELAGHGQYIYRNLANWVGVHHEGYWRDPDTPACPDPSQTRPCFSYYKSQQIGINETEISGWLINVIDKQQKGPLNFEDLLEDRNAENSDHNDKCECS